MSGTCEPIVLRREELPDEAVVIVRGGVLGAETIRHTAGRNQERFGFFGVSIEAALDVTWEELCRTSPRIAGRYSQVRLSTAGRVRRAGFALLATSSRPHYDIALADLEDDTVERLIGAFDDPIESPGKDVEPGEEYPR